MGFEYNNNNTTMQNEINLDRLDEPSYLNKLQIHDDEMALEFITELKSSCVNDQKHKAVLSQCESIIKDISTDAYCDYGPDEMIQLCSMASIYPEKVNKIAALSTYMLSILDFIPNEKEIPADLFLDAAMLIGNLATPGWEKSFSA